MKRLKLFQTYEKLMLAATRRAFFMASPPAPLQKRGEEKLEMMALDFEKNNEDIRVWGHDAVNQMQANASAMNVQHRSGSPSGSASLPKLVDRYRQKQGSIDMISFKFPRTLIWTQKGAGKGRGGLKGSKWTDKYGNSKSTNPRSLGKAGTGGRTEKPFINKVLDGPKGIDELATIVAVNTGDAIIANLFVK